MALKKSNTEDLFEIYNIECKKHYNLFGNIILFLIIDTKVKNETKYLKVVL